MIGRNWQIWREKIIILLGIRMVIKIVKEDRENLFQTNVEE